MKAIEENFLAELFNNELAKESCLNMVLILDRLVLLNSHSTFLSFVDVSTLITFHFLFSFLENW